MEHLELKDYLSHLGKSLNENTSCLVRIEERLKNFIDRVEEHEEDLEDVKKHVQTVRTASRVFSWCIGVLVAIAGVWKISITRS